MRLRVIMLVTSMTVTLVCATASPVMADDSSTGDVPAVEACYMTPFAAEQRLPFSVSQSEWCHAIYRQVSTRSLDGAVEVSWEPASSHVFWYCGPGNARQDCPITEYRVETYGPDGPLRCSASPDKRSCILTGLRNARTYQVTLSAYVSNGNWFRKYLVETPCCEPPGSPTAITAVAQGNALDITWAAPRSWGGATELQYSVSTLPPSGTCETTALACRIDGAAYGMRYRIQVTAANRTASGEPSLSDGEVAVPLGPPDSPSIVQTRYPMPGRATVVWSAPANDGGSPVSEYTVNARPGNRSCTRPAAATSCTITGLTGGRFYSFTVTAKNALGDSPASTAAVSGVLVSPATAPRNVRANVSGSSARVSWTRPTSLGGGRLLQYVVRTTTGSRSCETRSNSCLLTGLGLGRTYGIEVTAMTSGGRGRPGTVTMSVPAPRAEPPKPEQELS